VVVAQMPSQFQSIKTAPLPYDYDDVSSPIAAPVGPAAAPIAAAAGVTVTSQKIPEMVGATSAPVVLSGKPATVQIAVDHAGRTGGRRCRASRSRRRPTPMRSCI
jgi:hypothetical protein